MATPGWYPDPAGDPTAERYWDGASWHPTTRPRAAGPFAGPPAGPYTGPFDSRDAGPFGHLGHPAHQAPPGPTGRGPRRTGLVAGVVALALVLIAGAVVAVVLLTRDGGDRSTAGGAGDPVRTESPEDLATPDPTALPEVDTADCPAYDDSVGVRSAGDGKVHGGGMAMPVPAGYTVAEDQLDHAWPFPWGRDFQFAERQLAFPFYSTVSLSRLPRVEGYDGTKATAALILTCIVESDLWYTHSDWTVELSEGREVDGHEGWLLTAHVDLADEGYDYDEETTYVMVVDMGPGEDYGLFAASTTVTEEHQAVNDAIMGGLGSITVGR